MSHTSPTVIITSLTAVGAVACALTAPSLVNNEELQAPLNPFGINRSPYGEVFAMALQGPINTNFHAGMYGATEDQMILAQEDSEKEQPGNLLIVKPDPKDEPKEKQPQTLMEHMQQVMSKMQKGHLERTNPVPASKALKSFLRRQAEEKLRFAYNLDPSHYANYTSLHFFLTEGISSRTELTATTKQLADETIEYCLQQQYDPRPALTAAAACTNMLQFMFTANYLKGGSYTVEEMQFYLKKLDESIEQYEAIGQEWNENGNWQRISTQRFDECTERYKFILQIRSLAEKTIPRLGK